MTCEHTECPEVKTSELPAPATNTTAAEQPGVRASGEGQQSRTDSCTAIGGGLGALAVVQALTLVGVVLGWVWHCRRNTRKFSLQEK